MELDAKAGRPFEGDLADVVAAHAAPPAWDCRARMFVTLWCEIISPFMAGCF